MGFSLTANVKCLEALLVSLWLADCGVSTLKVSQTSDDDVVVCVTNLTNGGENG